MFLAVVTIVFHLVLPLAWLGGLARRTPASWVVRALGLFSSALYVVFIVYAGAGWMMLGWYTRWALAVVAVPLWLLAASRVRGVAAWPRGFWRWVGAGAALALAVYMTGPYVSFVTAEHTSSVVDVHSPLPAGANMVLQGGEMPELNHHWHVRAQHYALDIVRLNAAGVRARGLAPAQLADYASYGVTLRAPCAGEVLFTRDELEDQPAGLPGEEGRRTPLGNTVLLHCSSDITVVLAHLQRSSVRVVVGQQVAVGDVLGAVGNTGNTTEPHLHLHAVRGRVSDPTYATVDAEPVLLSIDGQVPRRNDLLHAQASAAPAPSES
ncbi:MAG: hypothetical protein RL033_5777 [Pseudomonadota bacterium]|jgi:hypothetical protein